MMPARAMLEIYAAGSLRAPLVDLARNFEKKHAVRVELTFGASGLLKDRILGGASPQVFASANMEHPEALASAGKARQVSAFARNAMCVLAAPTFDLQGKTLALRLLDRDVRLATSTPLADPSGDYAFSLFERIEATGAAGPGSAGALKRKALQLTGGADSPRPPEGRSVYGELVATGQADAFVTYCTNATLARAERPTLQILPVPEAINVFARYGLALLGTASDAADAYLQCLLGAEGRAVLGAYGFSAP